MTTPNKTIFPDKVAWDSDIPPVHCWWFSENSMKFMANKIRCDVEFVDFSEYYKEKPTALYLMQGYPTYRFRENGEVIVKEKELSFIDKLKYLFFKSSIIENGKRTFFEKFAYLFLSSKIYKRCKAYSSPNTQYFCSERGPITCAVYKKPT